jgi:hybrid cluster-associated redox disulfide protein
MLGYTQPKPFSQRKCKGLTVMFTAETLIRDVIAAHPDAAAIFEKHGLACASCLAASMESVSSAAHVHEISLESLLSDLNKLDLVQSEKGDLR